jgi:hypothetical protein
MSVEKMALMPVVDSFAPITQAVMYEKTAAKYIMLGIHDFRKMVDGGMIPFRTHPGRNRRIYLKSDLDEYLRSLPRGNIDTGRVPPGSERKGNQGGRS